MITLISRWQLRDGCPPELAAALTQVAADVRDHEPRTLVYSVQLAAPDPLGPDQLPRQPAPAQLPDGQQQEVVFFEVYADAQAFSDHVRGPTFGAFLAANLQYFQRDPANPDAPLAETSFYDRRSAFFRPSAAPLDAPASDASDEQQISALVHELAARLTAKDTDGLLELVTDDVVFMPTSGGRPLPSQAYVGRAAVRALLQGMAATLDIHIEPTVREVIVLGDTAFARDTYAEHTQVIGGPCLQIAGSECMLLRRTDAGWRFARYMFSITSNAPA